LFIKEFVKWKEPKSVSTREQGCKPEEEMKERSRAKEEKLLILS